MQQRLPLVVIVDGAIGVTGSFKSALRQAELFSGTARYLLLLPKNSEATRTKLPPNLKVATLPMEPLRKSAKSMIFYLPGSMLAAARLARVLRRHHAVALQVNDFYLLHGHLVRLFGWRGRMLTMVRIDPRRYGLIGKLWMAAAARASDAVVAVSHFIAGLMPGEVQVLHNPAQPASAPRADTTSPPILLFVGNYISGKGQDAAIKAFHRIAADFPDATLRFCGGDMGLEKNMAYRQELERLAEDGPGAGRIEFLPFVDDPLPLLRDARAALNFSHSESFSLTCQEASSAGLPVIATRCGGPEEIIVEGETGYLVNVDDVPTMADRMRRLLARPTLAARMGGRGRVLMRQRFGVERWSEEMTTLLGLTQSGPATVHALRENSNHGSIESSSPTQRS